MRRSCGLSGANFVHCAKISKTLPARVPHQLQPRAHAPRARSHDDVGSHRLESPVLLRHRGSAVRRFTMGAAGARPLLSSFPPPFPEARPVTLESCCRCLSSLFLFFLLDGCAQEHEHTSVVVL